MTAPDSTAPADRSGVEPQPGPFIARGVSRDLSGSLDSSSMVERLAVNEDAAGSNPAYPAKFLLPANSPDIREFAALVFVGLFFAVVLVALLLLRLIPFGEMFR